MHSLRRANRSGRRWQDEVTLLAAGSKPASSSGLFLVSECEADVSQVGPPTLVHRTPLDPGAVASKILKNSEKTVVSLPHSQLDGLVVPRAPLESNRFWDIMDRLGPSFPLALCTLRRRLARTPDDAAGFQYRLIELSRVLVDRYGATWAQAMAATFRGAIGYEDILMGRRRLSQNPDLEAADLTDIAEDIVGQRIEIPGYGDSRSGAGQRDGAGRPRWLSWRAVAARDGERMEVFYFGERPWRVSIRSMLHEVRETMEADGMSVEGDIETWIPDGLASVPAPYMVVYAIARPGPENIAGYLADVGVTVRPRR